MIPPLPSKSILVVEDEELLAEAIKLKLQQSGFKVLGARTVDQAWDYLNEIGPVSAVWLDHFLPEKNGDVLVDAMKHDPRFAAIPIFLVTNTIEPKVINKYIRLGIAQYYVKVITKLENIIHMVEAELQLREQQAGSAQ